MGSEFNYDALAERLVQAQSAFRRTYEAMYPYPDKPKHEARRDWLMRAALVVIMIGAAVVSGDHTINVFARDKPVWVGVSAFAMLEVSLFVLSFYVTREKYRSRDDIQVVGYMGKGIIVAFVVLLLGNFSDVMQSNGFATGSLWTAFKFIISTGIALSAPAMALIVGHVLAMLFVQDMVSDRRIHQEYEALCKAWAEGFEQAWRAQKSRWGATVTVEIDRDVLPVQSVRPALSERTMDSGQGYKRDSSASNTVREYLDMNPEAIHLPVRELADTIGVGKSTVAKVLSEMRK